MPKEWTVLHQPAAETGQVADRPRYYVSIRKVGIFGSGKPVDAGRFQTREEADAFVAQHMGRDDSVTHVEPQVAQT
jgi:hypothetical protein